MHPPHRRWNELRHTHAIRYAGAFISDEEVETVVRFLKDQGEPVYIDAVTEGESLVKLTSPKATPEPGDAT